MHPGFIGPAVRLYEVTLSSILCLRGIASKEYSEAALSMVEIQYSKGPTEVAKAWCLRLLEDHYTVLRQKPSTFIVGREYGDISSIETGNCNDLILDERVKSRWIYCLKSAAENGNFPAALFIIRTILNFPVYYGLDLSPLGDGGQCNFLIPTMSSDSLATISPLLQHRDYLGDASRQSMDDALLKTGAAVNVPPKGIGVGDVSIWPPLHIAIRYGYGRQFISALIEHGADVNCVFRGITPLALAIYNPGHSPAKLHQLGVPSGHELLISRMEIIEQLLKKEADVNKMSMVDGLHLTPLQQAQKGLASIEELLLLKPAEPRTRRLHLEERSRTPRTTSDTTTRLTLSHIGVLRLAMKLS